jgi:hypothetical protein
MRRAALRGGLQSVDRYNRSCCFVVKVKQRPTNPPTKTPKVKSQRPESEGAEGGGLGFLMQ